MLTKTLCKRHSSFLARVLAITIPALLLISLISVSCGTTKGAGLTVNSCVEHTMNTTVILGGELLKNVTTDVALPVLLCLMIAWVFAKKIGKRLPAAVSFRLKFLSWLWAKRRPFSDSKTFVPVFVAMRDA